MLKHEQKTVALLASVAFCPRGRAKPCYACMDTPCTTNANCDAGCTCRVDAQDTQGPADTTDQNLKGSKQSGKNAGTLDHRGGKKGGKQNGGKGGKLGGAPPQGQCVCTSNATSALASAPPLGKAAAPTVAVSAGPDIIVNGTFCVAGLRFEATHRRKHIRKAGPARPDMVTATVLSSNTVRPCRWQPQPQVLTRVDCID